MEKLKAITESPSVWEPAYALVVGDDDTRVPECAERFMQLIAGITGKMSHEKYLAISSDSNDCAIYCV